MSGLTASAPSFRMILDAVSHEFGVSVLDLESRRSGRRIARPRQMVMWLARHLTRLSLPQIGQRLGGRDHTTVMHGVRKIDQLLDLDPAIATKAALLKDALSAGQMGSAVFFVAWTRKDGTRAISDRPRSRNDAQTVAMRFGREFHDEPHIVLAENQLQAWLRGDAVEGVSP